MVQAEGNKYQKRIWTIPNVLSMVRLLLIPVIIWLYVAKQDYLWACIVLLLSAATDIVDGIIARKCNMVSDLGKALDPVADKLTQLAMLYCLVGRFPLMLIPLCVLAVKELLAAVTSLMAIRKTQEVNGAVWHGKVCTVLLYATMALHLLWFTIPAGVSAFLIVLCTGAMLFSGILYTRKNLHILCKK